MFLYVEMSSAKLEKVLFFWRGNEIKIYFVGEGNASE